MVGCVADANVKVGKGRLDHVADEDFEAFLLGFAHYTLGDFGGHCMEVSENHAYRGDCDVHTARIHLYRYYSLGFLEDANCQVASTGADF